MNILAIHGIMFVYSLTAPVNIHISLMNIAAYSKLVHFVVVSASVAYLFHNKHAEVCLFFDVEF